METTEFSISVLDLVTPIAEVVDIMSPVIGRHHMQVAYLSYRLAEELGFSAEEKYELAVAGSLHDIGAFSLQERLDLLEFEQEDLGSHAMAGYLFLKDFRPFQNVAGMIKYHHLPWNDGEGNTHDGERVPAGSNILNLADRVAVKVSLDKPVLGQVPEICSLIQEKSGQIFRPEYVEAMISLAKKDYIWLEMISNSLERIISRSVDHQAMELDLNDLLAFSKLLCKIIDFKSRFTSTHTSGVVAATVMMASYAGLSPHESRLLEIAAYLHDLGKLAIPSEILEKPEVLSDDEWFVMRSHAYYTYKILEPLEILQSVRSWGALHQERMDGSGYPFNMQGDDIPLGARIIAVADMFTAISEDRPYRGGMDKAEAISTLQSRVDDGELDGEIVNLVIDNYDQLDEIRDSAQKLATREYTEFQELLRKAAL